MKNPPAPRHDYVTTGQFRWDPLDYVDAVDGTPNVLTEDEAAKLALSARNRWVREHRKMHPDIDVHSWTLTDQLRKYSGLGQPDGRVRNVYYVTVTDNRPRVS